MSFHVFFSFSSGLSKTIQVPKGTLQGLIDHVEHVEQTLGLKRTQYLSNPPHWDTFDEEYRKGFPGVTNEVLCQTVEEHNEWVRAIYAKLAQWSQDPVENGEELTPENIAQVWHGFQELGVEPTRWTEEYYRARMESLYEVMRGRESDGMIFDTKALTPKQAANVVRLFEQYLDVGDLRLDVPYGHDRLESSYDGGYSWCDKCCRPMDPNDAAACRRRKCPLVGED